MGGRSPSRTRWSEEEEKKKNKKRKVGNCESPRLVESGVEASWGWDEDWARTDRAQWRCALNCSSPFGTRLLPWTLRKAGKCRNRSSRCVGLFHRDVPQDAVLVTVRTVLVFLPILGVTDVLSIGELMRSKLREVCAFLICSFHHEVLTNVHGETFKT